MNILRKNLTQTPTLPFLLSTRRKMSSDFNTSLQYSELRFSELKHSLSTVKDEIVQEVNEVGRSVNSVDLVAVSKYMPASDIKALYDLGHRHFGENYVQELTQKAEIVSITLFKFLSVFNFTANKFRSSFQKISSGILLGLCRPISARFCLVKFPIYTLLKQWIVKPRLKN